MPRLRQELAKRTDAGVVLVCGRLAPTGDALVVNMVGFHHEEPKYNTAAFGEEGHYFEFRPRPTAAHPHRAKIAFPCGQATFLSFEDAGLYLDHPGDVAHAAEFYRARVGVSADNTRKDG